MNFDVVKLYKAVEEAEKCLDVLHDLCFEIRNAKYSDDLEQDLIDVFDKYDFDYKNF